MGLDNVAGGQPLLDTCAETLRTLRFRLESPFYPFPMPKHNFDLSHHTILRSMEVRAELDSWAFTRTPRGLLPAITSPVFSEIVVVFVEEAQWPPLSLAEVLREAYQIGKFRLAFCLETVDWVGQRIYEP
ncbi:hypothetical protein BDM02DRAFT_3189594 [Thelephora ganbajun]|uniref:Uncharacterized protein n=1 Tax=Thelephora ganbajun TaxID=370292 RepID=A0ACB6Z7T0_THEGA|nr:hypothetical protein BDM02DRAFT_3189594 [Thelephora ganbajun]